MRNKPLDVIAIGRTSVDLYGNQVGGRLEDMSSFAKYLGGSPANTAVGVARLGLKSALITAVGDEHMGRFIRETLMREGVETSGVKTDPQRLSALVILGIRDKETFPLIFYRENCADMGLTEDDIDPDFIRSSKSVVLSGTHFSTADTAAASRKAAMLCREAGGRVAFDIDYRPVLWGIGGHDSGEARYISSSRVTEHLQSILPLCDLVVGTEEELHIAGGTVDTLSAIKTVREKTDAVIVCKRGPMGCVIFPGAIPDRLELGINGPGFPIEVYNVLGAGDAFMSGFLSGWIRNEPWENCARYANACGAFAVSRHGCTPAYPSAEELQYFLKNGSSQRALRKDAKLEQIHWSTNRRTHWPALRVFAFDHRAQLEEMARAAGAEQNRIGAFKALCLRAAMQVAAGNKGYGILCDNRLGQITLHAAAETGLWIGRPVEWPGSRPLELEPEIGPDCGGLSEWPQNHVVKALVFYHPDDDEPMKTSQEDTLIRVFAAARRNRLDFLLEIIPSRVAACADDATARIIGKVYDLGIYPDWWKLEPMKNDAAWTLTCAAITKNDPYCRGIVVLGLDAPQDHLAASFKAAARHELVKGFAVGRTIFGDTARAWFAGEIADDEAVNTMAKKYSALCELWDKARKSKGEAT